MPQVGLPCAYGWDRAGALALGVPSQVPALCAASRLSAAEASALVAEVGQRAADLPRGASPGFLARRELLSALSAQMDAMEACGLARVLRKARGLTARQWEDASSSGPSPGRLAPMPGSLSFAAYLAATTLHAAAWGGRPAGESPFRAYDALAALAGQPGRDEGASLRLAA